MIELLTANTVNGIKVPLALEELGLDYRIRAIGLGRGEQKQAEFLKLNPNGRIPMLIDAPETDGQRPVVFESGAILLHLAERYGGLLPRDPARRGFALSLMFLQASGQGPAYGQAKWAINSAPAREPIAIARHQAESARQTQIVEDLLSQHTWIAGETYSIVDIAYYGWLRNPGYAGLDPKAYPRVGDWVHRLVQRPASQRALARIANELGDAWAKG